MYSSLHFCVGMADVQPIVEEAGAARDTEERNTTVTLVIGNHRISLLNILPWQMESIASDLLSLAQDVSIGNNQG